MSTAGPRRTGHAPVTRPACASRPRRTQSSAPPGGPVRSACWATRCPRGSPSWSRSGTRRMTASPFAFFRGAAAVMAGDLAGTPVSGLDVQLCGDAHLANFGMFASPERALAVRHQRLRRDLPRTVGVGPQAARGQPRRGRAGQRLHGQADAQDRASPRSAATATPWRRSPAWATSPCGTPGWTSSEARRLLGDRLDPQHAQAPRRSPLAKARSHDHLRALDKLTEVVDGRRRIVADPPLVVPVSDLAADLCRDEVESTRRRASSRTTPPRSVPATASWSAPTPSSTWPGKVVGVGSVGTRCWIVADARPRRRRPPVPPGEGGAGSRCWRRYLGPRPPRHRGRAGGRRPADHAGGRATSSWAGTARPGSTG